MDVDFGLDNGDRMDFIQPCGGDREVKRMQI